MQNLSLYLNPTYYINHDTPTVLNLYEKIMAGNPENPICSIFYFVRDWIKYNPYSPFYLPEHYPASRTIVRGEGYCIQKAVLLAALARAHGIPARLAFADIRNHRVPLSLWNMMQTDIFIFHGYSELYIEGRWISVTPTFDLGMCSRLKIRPIEFDGRNQAVFHSHDLEGRLHIEYIAHYGHFADLPFRKLMKAFRRAYPEDMLQKWKDAAFKAPQK